MQRRRLFYAYIEYSLYAFMIMLRDLVGLSDLACGVSIVIIVLISTISLIKKRLLFSPLILPELMMGCFGLYSMKLVTTVSRMPGIGCYTVILSMFFWKILSLSNRYLYKQNGLPVFNVNKSKFGIAISIITIIGVAFMLMEWHHAGGIPVLRSDAETFRFTVSINGITHILAIMLKFVPVFVGIFFVFDSEPKIKISYWLKNSKFLVLSLVSLVFMLGTAFRGELVFAVVIIGIAAFVFHQPNVIKLIKYAIPILIILGVYPIIRGYWMYGDSYIAGLKGISNYTELWFMTPIYQTFAFNFEILNRDFLIFPHIRPFGFGGYSFLCYLPFFDLAPKLGTVQNEVWSNGFYANLTATFYGDWYADYGFIGCILGSSLICLWVNYLYKKWKKNASPKYLMMYAYTFYQMLVMVYSNTFDFVYFCYMFLIWGTFAYIYKNDSEVYRRVRL